MLVDEIESTKIEEKCRNYVIRNLCLKCLFVMCYKE